MANIQSAKKRARQNIKRRDHNREVKDGIKKQLKTFYRTIEEGNYDKAREEYNTAASKLDKAAKTNIIHKNKAARKKSQLAKALKTIE